MKTSKKKEEIEITITELTQDTVHYAILGTSPLLLNSMPEKLRQYLTVPPPKKTAAEKAGALKHNPYQEFRDSIYRMREDQPTLIGLPSVVFKKAIAQAAIDIPGATKAQLLRLLYVAGDKIPIYGVPRILMRIVRCADINKTPDIRTRAIIPQWAAFVSVSFTTPIIKEPIVSSLFAAAGIINGLGDWRPQKGGDYGKFELVSGDDKRIAEIVKSGDRKRQISAMEKPEPYDLDTEDLLIWFDAEVKRRGFKEVA